MTAASWFTPSLHDALPIYMDDLFGRAGQQRSNAFSDFFEMLFGGMGGAPGMGGFGGGTAGTGTRTRPQTRADRKSTRLNSSHVAISYAVFCLKKIKDCTRE